VEYFLRQNDLPIDSHGSKEPPSNSKAKVLISLLILTLVVIALWKYPVIPATLSIVEWINNNGTLGYLVFVVAYIAGSVLLLPGTILTLGAGFIWSVVLGSVLVSIASTLGATASFFVGRYLARDWVAKKVESKPGFQSIDKAVSKEGFKIVLLTRLSPIFPFNILNYAYGITGVKARDYILASWLGMIPGTIMYVYFGSLITEFAQLASGNAGDNPAGKIFYYLGLVVTVIVTIFVTKLARKALKRQDM
jgi:uncharacterized membrane protein YdjX (TVP38/TMEM64 family)